MLRNGLRMLEWLLMTQALDGYLSMAVGPGSTSGLV
jgi:hypothetical protein